MLAGYVIQNPETRRYVARPGNEHSYTRNILEARRFATKQAAQSEACGNELVLFIDSIFGEG